GNPGSEAGHNLVSWGPIEPANTGGHYGGVEDCRVIWAPAAPEEPWATIDLDFGECYGPKCLTLQHLEGAAEDAFDVLLYPPGEPENARLLFSYPGSPGTSEVWHKTAIRVLTSGIMTVKLVAQGEAWSGFGTYGQVAFDAIRVDDWVPVCSFVDIGVPESESGHNLQGWGPIEPETSGGNYGGIANCRAVYASEANGDGNDWATVDLDLGGCACPLSLKLHHLDGLAKDAFNVFLYPAGHPEASELIFSWAGDELTEEIWYMSSVTIEGTGIHTIKFVSTEPPWAHFDTYGQMCINTIMVVPCQTFAPPASIPTAALHPGPALHLQPNPFRTSTALQLRLNDATPVTFLIYDIQGRQVRRVADQLFQPGQHQLIWDGKDASGHPVAPGIYLYQVRMDGRADMNGKVIHVR
ncbi:MAG: T9SS type A sorting domain-containing protein, partial [Candidatus Eisenbacteria sp.]|nr:T9SS type A sorting domain-containing protein [Candidatus Eisenbacteria bacterium]